MVTRRAIRPTIDRKAPTTKKSGDYRVVKTSRSKQGPRRSTRAKSTSSPTPRPSDRWASYEGVDEFHANNIKDIFRKGDWSFLCSEAVNCYRGQSAKRGERENDGITCNIMHNRFACGARNLVLEVAFSDSTYWVVRIRFPDDGEDDPEVEKGMHSEVATMRLIQERTSIPVATIFGYNAKQQNPFGYSFMFMSVLPGRHLDNHLALSVPKQQQAKVAEQLAEILHQLNTRMTFEMIGRVWRGESGNEEPSIISFNAIGACKGQLETSPISPFSTSLEYFYTLRQNENAAIRAGILRGSWARTMKKCGSQLVVYSNKLSPAWSSWRIWLARIP
jgi:hypothetical protein